MDISQGQSMRRKVSFSHHRFMLLFTKKADGFLDHIFGGWKIKDTNSSTFNDRGARTSRPAKKGRKRCEILVLKRIGQWMQFPQSILIFPV